MAAKTRPNNKLLGTDFLDRPHAENNFRFVTHFFLNASGVVMAARSKRRNSSTIFWVPSEWKKKHCEILSLIANPFQKDSCAHQAQVGFSITHSAPYRVTALNMTHSLWMLEMTKPFNWNCFRSLIHSFVASLKRWMAEEYFCEKADNYYFNVARCVRCTRAKWLIISISNDD